MRFLFSSLSLSIILSLFISCNKEINECKGIKYDGILTTMNGKKFTGKCKTIYKNGSIRSIREYSNGMDHGEWSFFFLNGLIQTSGTFNKGIRIGQWKYYHKNGQERKIQSYDAKGKKTGRWLTFSEEGEIVVETLYSQTP
jgi:antitoxin component YwqK of YwqJK toxin-antitoxin module